MTFRNNDFTHDTDGQHSERGHIMENGIVIYGAGLGFLPQEIAQIAGYVAQFDAALSAQKEEAADVDEVYVELNDADAAARKQYEACQSLVKAEMTFAEPGTVEYLAERFDMTEPQPDRRADFVKVARYMLTGYDNIGVEHPDVSFPAAPFELLRTLALALDVAIEKIPKEMAEKKEATAVKNQTQQLGIKLYRRVYHRALAFWGNDDNRLLELGILPKSQIFTPGEELAVPKMLVFDQMRTMFSWQAVVGATAYELQVKNTVTQEIVGQTTPANKLYMELAKGGYSAKVRALKETDPAQESDWSVEIAVNIAFGAPGNLKYIPGLQKFTWDAVADATLYQLVMQGAPEDIYLGVDRACPWTVVGTQKFRVRAANDETSQWGEWSAWLSVTA